MTYLTLPGMFVLSCCFFLSIPVFGSTDAKILVKHYVRISDVGGAQLATTAVAIDPPSKKRSSESDKSGPEDNAPKENSRVPDSYVGTVVGLMFLAGIALLMTKWPRRRIRRRIYEFGRPKSREYKRRAS
jgi:hypothetical protein